MAFKKINIINCNFSAFNTLLTWNIFLNLKFFFFNWTLPPRSMPLLLPLTLPSTHTTPPFITFTFLTSKLWVPFLCLYNNLFSKPISSTNYFFFLPPWLKISKYINKNWLFPNSFGNANQWTSTEYTSLHFKNDRHEYSVQLLVVIKLKSLFCFYLFVCF